MFTGIIEAIGEIAALTAKGGDYTLEIKSQGLDLSDVKLGDSIACNGVCLTVTHFTQNSFSADVSNETVAHSSLAGKKVGDKLNLEKAMLATSRFGGHIVTGHVDSVAEIKSLHNDGRSIKIDVAVPATLKKYIAAKGSITVDGVSLTANELTAEGFLLNIVPHTAEQTIIAGYGVGSVVNIEVDIIARYVEQLSKDEVKPSSKITQGFLAENGFLK